MAGKNCIEFDWDNQNTTDPASERHKTMQASVIVIHVKSTDLIEDTLVRYLHIKILIMISVLNQITYNM